MNTHCLSKPLAASPARPKPLTASASLACAAILLGSLACSTSYAAQWLTVVPDKKGKVEVDTASIERSPDGKVLVWHRETYTPARLQEAWAFSYSSVKQLTAFQCEKRLNAPIRRIFYGASNSELKSEGFDATNATPIVPETPVEAVFNYACKKKAEVKPAE
ncbi:MAG: surface-adhesin E family protein, partial [Sterolibacterium sp.]